MAWENSNEIAWGHDLGFLNLPIQNAEDIKRINPEKIEASIFKPVREMAEYEEKVIYYPNGDMITFFTYSLFPDGLVDNIPLFNSYGQKIYNIFMENNNMLINLENNKGE